MKMNRSYVSQNSVKKFALLYYSSDIDNFTDYFILQY